MLKRTVIGSGPDFTVADVRCDTESSDWSDIEVAADHELVLVRRGCFRRHARVGTWLVDAGLGYFEHPGEKRRVSHPSSGGDACTAIVVGEQLVGEALPDGCFFTDRATEALHRAVLEDPSLDNVVTLVDSTVGLEAAPPHRSLVETARRVLTEHPAVSLEEAAALLGVSAPHLSRVFRAGTGETFSRYRNRLRVRAALELIRDGAPSLARVAAELGFSDQAHLTRTVKRESGVPPRVAAGGRV